MVESMTFSAYSTEHVSPAASNFDHGRAGVKLDRFVLHHQASDNSDETLRLMHTGEREVSATYVVRSNGVAVGVVNEEDTPYTNDDIGWNRRSITFEIENVLRNGDPYGKPSDQAHEVVARILADASDRYGITLDRAHVLGHRELYSKFGVGYATVCPGDLDITWCVNRAIEIRAWRRFQLALQHHWGYTGDIDGLPGIQTWMAVQRLLTAQAGYTGTVDGVPAGLTYGAFQRFLTTRGYGGTITGKWTAATSSAFVRWGNTLPVVA